MPDNSLPKPKTPSTNDNSSQNNTGGTKNAGAVFPPKSNSPQSNASQSSQSSVSSTSKNTPSNYNPTSSKTTTTSQTKTPLTKPTPPQPVKSDSNPSVPKPSAPIPPRSTPPSPTASVVTPPSSGTSTHSTPSPQTGVPSSASAPPKVQLGMKPAGQQPRPLGSASTTPPPNRFAQAGSTGHPSSLGKTPPPTSNASPGNSIKPSGSTSSAGAMRPPANLTALSNVSSNTLPPGATAAQPATPKPPPQQKKAVFATAGSSSPLMKYLPYIVGGVVVLIVLILIISSLFGGSESDPEVTPDRVPVPQTSASPDTGRQPVSQSSAALTYWGLWEPEEVMSEIISDFQEENPGISVQYVKQSHQDYRERLQLAIASGQGPDVFRFHSSWVPMLREELYPIPASVMSSSEFQASYYPVMATQLQNNGQFVGIPLMYDGLVLYYNEDILNTANAQPPQTWSELRTLAARLTIRNGDEIKRGGVALGNASNVEHFSDILAVLMLQNGADLSRPNTPEGRDALKFYTNFVKADKVWDAALPSSTVAFARGDVAMMFAPSWRAHEIKNINPNLNFKVTTLPRLAETRISWATYWAEGVNSKSEYVDEAWQFVEFISRSESLQKMFNSQSAVRTFGELYPRVNMATSLATDPIIAPFLQDAPYAKGWYMSSYTHDNGINDNIIKYYEDAVTAVLGNASADEAMVTVEQGVQQQLRQYNAL